MKVPTLQFPDHLPRQRFLDTCWQQHPVLLRQAIDPQACQLPPEELAGLACEEEVESRLVQHHENDRWSLQHGPFSEQDFRNLPDSDWTLLVQDVDKHLPDVAELLDAFAFLPDWRLDDIMISYATDQGGVGPHTDNYDVFLVQAQGRRRWRVSEHSYTAADLLPECPLRLLKDFHTDQDLVLEPGDVLYLPPGIAHWGTALGECMTWSVGMRGPSAGELLGAWLEHLTSEVQGHNHLRDGICSTSRTPSLLSAPELDLARDMMSQLLPGNTPGYRRWLGCFLTEPKPGFEILTGDPTPERSIDLWLEGQIGLCRHPWVRFALVRMDTGRTALCAQGEALDYPEQDFRLLDEICRYRRLSNTRFRGADQKRLRAILCALLQRGWLSVDA